MYQLNLYTRHHSATVYSLFYALNSVAAALYLSTHHQYYMVLSLHWHSLGLVLTRCGG